MLITGLILIAVVIVMRNWGRSQFYRNDVFKPIYQNGCFWFLFSIGGIALFIAGIVLIVLSLT